MSLGISTYLFRDFWRRLSRDLGRSQRFTPPNSVARFSLHTSTSSSRGGSLKRCFGASLISRETIPQSMECFTHGSLRSKSRCKPTSASVCRSMESLRTRWHEPNPNSQSSLRFEFPFRVSVSSAATRFTLQTFHSKKISRSYSVSHPSVSPSHRRRVFCGLSFVCHPPRRQRAYRPNIIDELRLPLARVER